MMQLKVILLLCYFERIVITAGEEDRLVEWIKEYAR